MHMLHERPNSCRPVPRLRKHGRERDGGRAPRRADAHDPPRGEPLGHEPEWQDRITQARHHEALGREEVVG